MKGKQRITSALLRIERVYGMKLAVNYQTGIGARVMTPDESREVSPRLPLRTLTEWLDGFEAALSEVDRLANWTENLKARVRTIEKGGAS